VPQALISVPSRVEGPNSIEFTSAGATYEAKRFDVHLGDTKISLVEYEGRLVGLVNETQGTVGYDAGRFPDGIEILGEEEPVALPEGVSEETLTFESAGLSFAGTLATPEGEGPFPGALFLHGSGPVDRDGNAMGMAMDAYRQLARGLAQVGIASLRFDKRGVGASEGDLSVAAMSDLLDDAAAALDALRTAPQVDPDRVVLIGHSEGAYLAPAIAGTDAQLAGIALLAGAAQPLDEVTLWQIETLLRQRGATEEEIAASLEQEDAYIAFVEGSRGQWSDYTIEELQAALPWLTEDVAGQLAMTPLGLPWLREHYTADTEGALRAVSIPVFALNGDKDLQVPPESGERIRAILEEAGNENVTVHLLEDLNHLLRHHPEDPNLIYRHVEDPVDPRVIELLQTWAVERLAID